MADKVEQAKVNPTLDNKDGGLWIRLEHSDLKVNELAKDGKVTGERSIKFAKSYLAGDINGGRSFSVVGEGGDVGGKFGGIFKGLNVTLKMIDPKAAEAKQKANMLNNFNSILRERTLLKKEKVSRKDGVSRTVPIVVRDRDVITLAMLNQWEKEATSVVIGHTFEEMLKADEGHSNPDKRGKWFEAYLKIKRELGQSTEKSQLEHLIQLAEAGKSGEEIAQAGREALAKIAEAQGAKEKARLVKSQANLEAQARFEAQKQEIRERQADSMEVVAAEVREEMTEQGID
jgi:hypothetical protein